MSLYDNLLRPMAFRFDPEVAHEAAMRMIERGIFKARWFQDPRLEQNLFGAVFQNPLGLAAGFDKNARALDYWHQLGFGHVECGTITWHAQGGNPKPRLFRLPEDHALINRMGFNNDGAAKVGTRIASAKSKIPVGINLGKSKITELKDAPKDYQDSFRILHTFGDYFVINVSSPNTPGLRQLQEKGALLEIVQAMREISTAKPVLVKVAPDLEFDALDDVIDVAVTSKLAGIIATNTTLRRENLTADPNQTGGLSGRPMRALSDDVLRHVYRNAPKDMILIGVGGIETAEDVLRKVKFGAHMCQLYTGWIYGGPQMVPNLLEDLVGLLSRDGFKDIAEARGASA